MRIEELQSSLEAQELRLTERNSEQELNALKSQTLKVSSGKKNQKQGQLENKKKYDGGVQNSELSNSDKKHQNVQKGKEKFDKRKVQCYSFNKYAHFAVDYWSNKVCKGEKVNIARGDSDDELVLLMAYENACEEMVGSWYIDTGCSNHLTGNKQ